MYFHPVWEHLPGGRASSSSSPKRASAGGIWWSERKNNSVFLRPSILPSVLTMSNISVGEKSWQIVWLWSSLLIYVLFKTQHLWYVYSLWFQRSKESINFYNEMFLFFLIIFLCFLLHFLKSENKSFVSKKLLERNHLLYMYIIPGFTPPKQQIGWGISISTDTYDFISI